MDCSKKSLNKSLCDTALKLSFGTSVVVEGQVKVQSEKIGVITSRLWSFCVLNFHCGLVCVYFLLVSLIKVTCFCGQFLLYI